MKQHECLSEVVSKLECKTLERLICSLTLLGVTEEKIKRGCPYVSTGTIPILPAKCTGEASNRIRLHFHVLF